MTRGHPPGLWSAEADDAHPLVALVHGTMDRSAGMLRVSRHLDHRYRVLRYDRRGYGRSVGMPPGVMAHQVDDLIGLLDGRRAVLVGHSFGGNVCLSAAAARPDLVAAVAVYETPLSWEPWWPGNSRRGAGLSADPIEAVEQFMTAMAGATTWAALPQRSRDARLAEGPAMVAELDDLRTNPPWSAADIAVPVVVGHGTNARPHHRQATLHLARSIPGCELVVIDGAGHGAPVTHPKEFAAALVGAALRRAGC